MSDLDSKVLDWFCAWKTGASSMCMAAYLTGRECDGSYPHDAGDFGRCSVLLGYAPELRELLPKMAEVNRYWAALVKHWKEIEALPDYKTKTELMRKVIRPIEEADDGVVRLSESCTVRFGASRNESPRSHSANHTWRAVHASALRHQWQPIETAPTDGTSVLLFGSHIEVGKYIFAEDEGIETWCDSGQTPTHWMQLPQPPNLYPVNTWPNAYMHNLEEIK